MTKSNFMRIGLIVSSILILIGVALTTYMMTTPNQRNVINVHIENGKTQAIKFEDLCLIPGEECEYTILLDSVAASNYDLMFDFHETEEKTLKNYAYARIEINDEVICDQLLATLFDGDDMTLPVDLTEDKKTAIKIVYYLPEDVGNEAQNAEAIFELLITASNE